MPINFPSTPSDGDLYTVGNQTWVYRSARTKWMQLNNAPIVVSATAPTGAQGQLWYDTTNDLLKIYTGTAWVRAEGYEVTADVLRTADIGVSVQAYSADILTPERIGVDVGSGFTYLTPIAPSSFPAGTYEFNNLPAGIREIDIFTTSISNDAATDWRVQLGSAADGGFVTSGYTGVFDQLFGSNWGNAAAYTEGIAARAGADVDISNTIVTWRLLDPSTNFWFGTLQGAMTQAAYSLVSTARVALSGELDRIRVQGITNFDTGAVYCRYR